MLDCRWVRGPAHDRNCVCRLFSCADFTPPQSQPMMYLTHGENISFSDKSIRVECVYFRTVKKREILYRLFFTANKQWRRRTALTSHPSSPKWRENEEMTERAREHWIIPVNNSIFILHTIGSLYCAVLFGHSKEKKKQNDGIVERIKMVISKTIKIAAIAQTRKFQWMGS